MSHMDQYEMRRNHTCGYAGKSWSALMEGDGVSDGVVVVGEWLGLLAPVAPSRALPAVGVEEGDFPEDSWDLVKVTDLFWSPCASGGNDRAVELFH